jgi:hypothetical protein
MYAGAQSYYGLSWIEVRKHDFYACIQAQGKPTQVVEKDQCRGPHQVAKLAFARAQKRITRGLMWRSRDGRLEAGCLDHSEENRFPSRKGLVLGPYSKQR